MDLHRIFKNLDEKLAEMGLERDIFICGGAALISLGVISRETQDIDVVAPQLDPAFLAIANRVGNLLGLKEGWFNNGPDDLLQHLEGAWKKRARLVFEGKSLRVNCLSRQDLLNTKLWAACDRIEDVPDIVGMKPNFNEIKTAKKWVLKCDTSKIWPQIVEECVQHIINRLENAQDE